MNSLVSPKLHDVQGKPVRPPDDFIWEHIYNQKELSSFEKCPDIQWRLSAVFALVTLLPSVKLPACMSSSRSLIYHLQFLSAWTLIIHLAFSACFILFSGCSQEAVTSEIDDHPLFIYYFFKNQFLAGSSLLKLLVWILWKAAAVFQEPNSRYDVIFFHKPFLHEEGLLWDYYS